MSINQFGCYIIHNVLKQNKKNNQAHIIRMI